MKWSTQNRLRLYTVITWRQRDLQMTLSRNNVPFSYRRELRGGGYEFLWENSLAVIEVLIRVCTSDLPRGTLSTCRSVTPILGSGHVRLYPLDVVPTHPRRALVFAARDSTHNDLSSCMYHGRTTWCACCHGACLYNQQDILAWIPLYVHNAAFDLICDPK